MRDLGQTLFYKVQFDVEAAQGNEDVPWSIVCCVRRWMGNKASNDGYQLPQSDSDWSDFKFGSSMLSEGNSDVEVALRSLRHFWFENNQFNVMWACEIRERVSQRGHAARTWVTEVGYSGTATKGVVSIVLSYDDQPGFIGPLQDIPSPTVPRIVKILLEDTRHFTCTIAGVDAARPRYEFDVKDAPLVYSTLTHEDREIPIVLIGICDSGELLVDPCQVHFSLGPSARVFYPKNPEAMRVLNDQLLPQRLECRLGSVRVFAPHPQVGEGDSYRHRLIHSSQIRGRGVEEVCNVLRRALVQDARFPENFTRLEEVRRARRHFQRERMFEEEKEVAEQKALKAGLQKGEEKGESRAIEQLDEDMQELCDDRDGWIAEAEQHYAENDQLRAERNELQARCDSYKAALEARGSGANQALSELFEEMTPCAQTSEDVVRLLLAVYPDQLDFTKRGWKSLKDVDRSKCELLWELLVDMATKLHPRFATKQKDPYGKFSSRFEAVKGEGQNTRKDPRLMAMRRDEYQGREISIEPHVKTATGNQSDANFIRAYFAWDEQTKRLVIGHAGGHLPNYTSQKIS